MKVMMSFISLQAGEIEMDQRSMNSYQAAIEFNKSLHGKTNTQ